MNMTRAEKARIAKERILKAALKLFSEKEFDDVSMQEIAAEAQCTAGNIYHYFKNKEELLIHRMKTDLYTALTGS